MEIQGAYKKVKRSGKNLGEFGWLETVGRKAARRKDTCLCSEKVVGGKTREVAFKQPENNSLWLAKAGDVALKRENHSVPLTAASWNLTCLVRF